MLELKVARSRRFTESPEMKLRAEKPVRLQTAFFRTQREQLDDLDWCTVSENVDLQLTMDLTTLSSVTSVTNSNHSEKANPGYLSSVLSVPIQSIL